MTMAGRLVVLGPNPALQKTVFLEALAPGRVNRALRVAHGLGGKGQNCARALAQLGHQVHLVEFLAGETGRRCFAGLNAHPGVGRAETDARA